MSTIPTREPERISQQNRGLSGILRRMWIRRFPTRKESRRAIFYSLLGVSAVFGSLVGLTLVSVTELPQIDDLERYRPSTTTELLDVHGRPFGSFALERRVVIGYNDIPPVLHDAILSIEDKTFESNAGINLFRAFGAAYVDMRSKGRRQGASTLTMQLSRNLFLSFEQTWTRKLQEVMLSVQIERHFTKEQIFTLYVNQIYLGHGTYGFEAGSEFYFSKHVHDLTLAEAALLAALPKGPVSYSPLRHPDRALRRRNLVLSEMLKDGKITAEEYAEATAAPLGLHIETAPATIAPYFVEEVRRQLEQQYGSEQVHGSGMRIYTSLDLDLQQVAEKAILDNLAAYERRHGWKGKLQNVTAGGQDPSLYTHPDWSSAPVDGAYYHALVVEVTRRHVLVRIGNRYAEILPADWIWTMTSADKILLPGDICYVRIEDAPSSGTMHASLQQDSGAQGSLMAIDNANGEILAMVGGRDYALSQFNRATQAERQVGSSFKPYVYTAAMEAGAKPNDIVVDAPTSFYTPNGPYTPHNYEPNYRGPMSLVEAFAESRNIPALKLANKVGIKKVIEVAHRFGITANIPNFLPVALGSASITLNEQVGAYSVFPNDGIRVEPHTIRRIVQADGLPLKQGSPKAHEVISVGTARNMMTLLKSVLLYGTAGQAGAELKHPLGGKTGTTNNYTDAWFVGFSPSVTCGTWIGYDERRSLGEKETGARAALPAWTAFMRAADARNPGEQFPSANAPKKSFDVNSANEDAAAAAKAKVQDDEDEDDDEPVTHRFQGAAPARPAPSVPSTSDAMPNDEAPAPPSPHSGYVASPIGPYKPYTGPLAEHPGTSVARPQTSPHAPPPRSTSQSHASPR